MPEPEAGGSSESRPEELSFEKAQFESPAPSEFSCSTCLNPIQGTYFRAGDAVYCSSCRWAAEAEAAKPKAGGPRRFGRAFLYGLGAAAAGTLIYFLVLWGTGYEVGLISILVGWLVGKAVFAGSEQTGGRKYQVMAAVLTYVAICASYTPLIVQEILKQGEKSEAAAAAPGASPDAFVQIVPKDGSAAAPSAADVASAQPAPESPAEMEPGAVYAIESGSDVQEETNPVTAALFLSGIILVVALAAPFLAGFENILGLLIIAFGLFEAWKLSAAREVVFEGPFAAGE